MTVRMLRERIAPRGPGDRFDSMFHAISGPSLRRPYAQRPSSEWQSYGTGRHVQPMQTHGRTLMPDIIYCAIGLAGFALAVLAVRAIERM